MKLEYIEKLRKERQNEVDSQKTKTERNQLGQYSTPYDLAYEITDFMVREWINRKPEKFNSIRFLEPAMGLGVFYSTLRKVLGENNEIKNALGVELDKSYFAVLKDLWNGTSVEVVNDDFTKIDPMELGKYNLLITNPPYVRHHHIGKEEKERLKKVVKELHNYDISGLSGLYCYFIWLAHKWLEEGAWASWLIPSEYMDVNYGKFVKKYLKEKVTLKFIHKYDPNNCHFSDAIVSSSVLIYENNLPKLTDQVRFSFGGSIENPEFTKYINIHELNPEDKWSWHLNDKSRNTKIVTLSDFFDVKRGIATGNNDFFVLDKYKIEEFQLPMECFTPLMPPSRELPVNVVDCDESGVPIVTKNYFVLNTSLSENDIAIKFPKLREYLDSGKAQGVLEGYLIKNRKIWYKQEERKPAPFYCTYMGRDNSSGNPFRFIWNKSNAIVTNGYLMLYPKGELKASLQANPSLYGRVFDALNIISDTNFSSEGREYGGGLKKIEPKELGNVSADSVLELLLNYNVLEQLEVFS